MKFGIDVSKWNGVIKWDEVSKNTPAVDFVICKCTEGISKVDPSFIPNVKGAIKSKIRWSGYHFATWHPANPVSYGKVQAKHFIHNIKKIAVKPDLPLILDVETNSPHLPLTNQQVCSFIKAFIGEVEAAGYECAIYSSPGFLNSFLPTQHDLGKYRLWAADYTGAINKVRGWDKVWLHQYTDKGKLRGIQGNVDLNNVL